MSRSGGRAVVQVRLSPQMQDDLDALAASAGSASAAIREALHLTRVAETLTPEEWTLLGHLNNPSDPELEDAGVELGGPVDDWSQRLAAELVGAWDGRPTPTPEHRAEKKRARELAGLVGTFGPVRGYALMAALRYFWRIPSAGIGACASPEIWMTPTAE